MRVDLARRPERVVPVVRRQAVSDFWASGTRKMLPGSAPVGQRGDRRHGVLDAGHLDLRADTISQVDLDRIRRRLRRNASLFELADRQLSMLTPTDVKAMVGEAMAEGYAPSTVRRMVFVLSLILDETVLEGRLARNATAG